MNYNSNIIFVFLYILYNIDCSIIEKGSILRHKISNYHHSIALDDEM